jgi:hypothetical protein
MNQLGNKVMKKTYFLIVIGLFILFACKKNKESTSLKPQNLIHEVKPKKTEKKLELPCLTLNDSILIKKEIKRIFSEKSEWNNNKNNPALKFDSEIVSSLFNEYDITNLALGEKLDNCKIIQAFIVSYELYKDEDTEHLIERSIQISFVQKERKLFVKDITQLAG